MIRLSVNLKKLAITSLLLLFNVFLTTINAQSIDFSIKVDSISSTPKTNVTVTILKGEPMYIYSIATEAPWKGGSIIIESAAISEKKYTFEGIPYGKYFIMVKDKSNEKASYQYITIPTSK